MKRLMIGMLAVVMLLVGCSGNAKNSKEDGGKPTNIPMDVPVKNEENASKKTLEISKNQANILCSEYINLAASMEWEPFNRGADIPVDFLLVYGFMAERTNAYYNEETMRSEVPQENLKTLVKRYFDVDIVDGAASKFYDEESAQYIFEAFSLGEGLEITLKDYEPLENGVVIVVNVENTEAQTVYEESYTLIKRKNGEFYLNKMERI